jgi:putative transposase
VKWLTDRYKNYGTIIVGYNTGWKKKVNMGKKMNRIFYEIPYTKLIYKLKDKLTESNQKLEIINESYTSKCDSLALEDVCFHEEYSGKRVKRGLFSSHPKKIYSYSENKMKKANIKGVLLNADVNGAINIMRKWKEKKGELMTEIKGKNICNPIVIKVQEYIKNQRKQFRKKN